MMSVNRTITVMVVTLALVAGPLGASAAGKGGSKGPPGSSIAEQTLSAVEVDDLMYMREEEKLARDVYLTMFDAWGLAVFDNIAASEQTHTDSVKDMIEKYRLADPVVDESVGVFVNQELATLYAQLIARGTQSALEALHVGAYIEELDIADLRAAIERTDEVLLINAYENLLAGSRNHLRAFVSQINALGVDYVAQVLDQDDVDAIVESMTLEEKVGQLFLLAFEAANIDAAETLFERHFVGGSYLSSDNLPDISHAKV